MYISFIRCVQSCPGFGKSRNCAAVLCIVGLTTHSKLTWENVLPVLNVLLTSVHIILNRADLEILICCTHLLSRTDVTCCWTLGQYVHLRKVNSEKTRFLLCSFPILNALSPFFLQLYMLSMTWYGISLCPVGFSCPSCVPSQLLAHPRAVKATGEAEKAGVLCRYCSAIAEAANVTTLFSPVIQNSAS